MVNNKGLFADDGVATEAAFCAAVRSQATRDIVRSVDFAATCSLAADGISHAFVISLARRRARKAIKQLERCNIRGAQHWPGVVGKNLFRDDAMRTPVSDDIKRLVSTRSRQAMRGARESWFEPHGPGSVGCYLSHVSVWYQVVANDLAAVAVFEDDVVCPGSHAAQQIAHHVREAGGVANFDVLWLSFNSNCGHGGLEHKTSYSASLYRTTGPGWCMQAYIVTNRGARRLLANVLPQSTLTDVYLFEKAKTDKSFVLLRPKTTLFQHPFSNTLQSEIGYNMAQVIPILVPAQWRLFVTGAITIVFISLIVALVFVSVSRERYKRELSTMRATVVSRTSSRVLPPRTRRRRR